MLEAESVQDASFPAICPCNLFIKDQVPVQKAGLTRSKSLIVQNHFRLLLQHPSDIDHDVAYGRDRDNKWDQLRGEIAVVFYYQVF